MYKNNFVVSFSLILILIILGCGEKKTETPSGEKSKGKDGSEKQFFASDKPFLVEFEIAASEKGRGTVVAIYHGKKCRSTSSMDIDGKKMTATAYFDGGDVVYTVTEAMGMKMGFKFDKSKFSEAKDQIDVNTFRDYLNQMEKVGEEEIIGYKCEIYRHKEKDFAISLYEKTVPLKFATRDGKAVLKAKRFESPYEVTDDMFVPPKDVDYKDMTKFIEGLQDMKNKDIKELEKNAKELEDVMKNFKK
ncbi:MAG: DUF4412 domain-containing protein [Ignavibacteria bacterium]|nr:DUF4412 domain-containing protein [Ignavibacteria bacterium]